MRKTHTYEEAQYQRDDSTRGKQVSGRSEETKEKKGSVELQKAQRKWRRRLDGGERRKPDGWRVY